MNGIPRAGRVIALVWVLMASACGPPAAGVAPAAPPSAQALWAEGSRLARAGQWVRAEQYLVAAQEAGAPLSRVLPLLLRVCLRSGQQRRALAHLHRALRAAPRDARLWVLAGAFAYAAGDLPQARRHLAAARQMTAAPADVAYWQARVALRAGERDEAAAHLRAYLERAPRGRFAGWAQVWLTHEKGGDS